METTESRELALYIINHGGTYQTRLDLARQHSPISWVGYVGSMVGMYVYEHGAPNDRRDTIFSTIDILAAAIEVVAYTEEHLRDM